MPIRISDLAPALLGGAAAAAGGPMAARPIRRMANYANDARSLRAQHLQNMEDWEDKYEENGRNQQALDFFASIDPGENPHFKTAKQLAFQGDLDGARRAWGQGNVWESQSASDLMPPTAEQIKADTASLGPEDSRTYSYRGGSQTVHGAKPAPETTAKLRYYTAKKPDGDYIVVYDEDQQRVIKEVLYDKAEPKVEEPKELSDVAYRRLLRKRALWGKPTGNAEVDSMSQAEARIELQSYEDSEVAYAGADALRNASPGPNSAAGAAQGGGGATATPASASGPARPPSSASTGQPAAASSDDPTNDAVVEKVVAGVRLRKVGPNKWVPVQ